MVLHHESHHVQDASISSGRSLRDMLRLLRFNQKPDLDVLCEQLQNGVCGAAHALQIMLTPANFQVVTTYTQ